jgi:hypothetical protein
MALEAVTLKDLKSNVKDVITSSEKALHDKLSSISSGDTVSNLQLLEYQMELASNSLTASIASSIAKERADTLKGIVQKF